MASLSSAVFSGESRLDARGRGKAEKRANTFGLKRIKKKNLHRYCDFNNSWNLVVVVYFFSFFYFYIRAYFTHFALELQDTGPYWMCIMHTNP